MKLTYVIGSDKRDLVKDIQNFQIDFKSSNFNWLQARQYENSMRQVFVDVMNDDKTPFNLTGCNVVFEGILPDKTHKIYDARDAIILDPNNGQFRFDMPKQAFAVAGSYVQAFFRIMRNGDSVTTLEFDMTVLADKVITGLVPADYITPFEDLYGQLETIIETAGANFKDALNQWAQKFTDEFTLVTNNLTEFKTDSQSLLTEWRGKFSDAVAKWDTDYANLVAAKDTLDAQLKTLAAQIDSKELITKADLSRTSLNDLALKIDISGLPYNQLPSFEAYAYYNGAGISQETAYYGNPEVTKLDLAYSLRDGSTTLVPNFLLKQINTVLPDFAIDNFVQNRSGDGKWMYLISGRATIGINCDNAVFAQ